MLVRRLVAAASTLLVITGCTDAGDALAPATSHASLNAQPSAMDAGQVPVSGEFAALVDFTTLSLTPRGRNCLLEVNGQLVFTGTIEGTATGRTSALVFAPCEEVATTPPGTFRDVFKSELVFEGTIDGEEVNADVLYMGGVEPGGAIDGRLVFSRGAAGRLDADARVAVGGTYSGSLVVK